MLEFEDCPEVINPLVACIPLAPEHGYFVEFGVAGGHSLRQLAYARPGRTIGLDTFEGLPERWREGYDAGAFGQNGEVPEVSGAELRKGLFCDLIPDLDVLPALVHIDCDLYQGAHEALAWFCTHWQPGTIVVFDEIWGYPGWEEHEYRAYQELKNNLPRHEWIFKSPQDCCKAAFRCL